jgi:hypothetical protein
MSQANAAVVTTVGSEIGATSRMVATTTEARDVATIAMIRIRSSVGIVVAIRVRISEEIAIETRLEDIADPTPRRRSGELVVALHPTLFG